MPGYVSGKFTDRDVFYNSYLQTYIERDVSELIDIKDKLQFRDFIRAAACRAGQMLNIHDIAQDVGVSDDTAKRWLVVLEKSDIIFYLRPYSNNLLKMNGTINGAILENYVVSEIIKSYHNCAKDFLCPKIEK